MIVNAIFARDLNGKMATDSGELPWRSSPFCNDPEIAAFAKADMENFKKTTIGNIVIMGYNTYLTFEKPLVGRWNCVIDRNCESDTEISTRSLSQSKGRSFERALEVSFMGGASTGSATANWHFFPSIENCLEVLGGLEKSALSRGEEFPKVFVIGGAKLLSECRSKNLLNGEVLETIFPWKF